MSCFWQEKSDHLEKVNFGLILSPQKITKMGGIKARLIWGGNGAGLEIVTNMVANATETFTLATKNYPLGATLASSFAKKGE